MQQPNETTEKIINLLAGSTTPVNLNHCLQKLKITKKELSDQLSLLQHHNIAQHKYSPIQSTIEKLSDFRLVIVAGSLQEFLKQQEIKKEKIALKDEKDEEIKQLQIQKLQHEVETMKKQFETLITFQKSGIARDHRQKWQFWITVVISLIALILSIVNFIKS